jgi:pyridoxal phosphate enzyme (YggS family)
MSATPSLASRLARLRARIAAACAQAGRRESDVRLIAVSKTQPREAILAGAELGVRDFGENRVQEALAKLPGLPAELRLHLIGPLQTNKVNKATGAFTSIQSVDRVELLQKLAARAAALGIVQEILLQVNVTGEPQKGGVEPAHLPTLWQLAQAAPSLRAVGLMTLGRAGAGEAECRRGFAKLAQLAGGLAGARELSMGMSDDFEWAILEGATQIRVGTALFGARLGGAVTG